jgi:DNA modification methylase
MTNHIKEDITLYSTKKLSVSDSFTCPLCSTVCKNTLAAHFKNNHSKAELDNAILADKYKGILDTELGQKYGITFRYLERLITQKQGVNISRLKISKKIKTLTPENFKEEQTTVWSFKSRGNWATHSGEYRGNWSPYIPRNIILKYSKPGETVLDYFCGAGTTAVESKLLKRKCIALDINKEAIKLAKKNINFRYDNAFESEFLVGDARDLSFLKDNSIDLICAHPPYTNIIHYTDNKIGDLSFLEIEQFLKEMEKVAKESFRILKPARQCAILIGDMRRHKNVIPLGFKLINVYLNAGFKLKELIIKRQHNCKTTGFWYTNSIKFNFLLLGHEYLPIFEKPEEKAMEVKEEFAGYGLFNPYSERPLLKKKLDELETTTVWIFSENNLERLLNKNVIDRYSEEGGYKVININSDPGKTLSISSQKKRNLLFIKSSCLNGKEYTMRDVDLYIDQLRDIIQNELPFINKSGYYVIQTKDIRVCEYIEPLAKRIIDSISFPDFLLKEIVVVTIENHKDNFKIRKALNLNIAHQYLLIYKRV